MNKEDVITILEVNQENANKLLKTGNCILLGVATISTENEECPTETEFLYSIGQIEYHKCNLCNDNTMIYKYDEINDQIDISCINGNYDTFLK